MFRVAKAKLCLGKVSQREAHPQVRPDEIKACLLGLGFQTQRFVNWVRHTLILRALDGRLRRRVILSQHLAVDDNLRTSEHRGPSRTQLNLDRRTHLAEPLSASVPKKMVAPKKTLSEGADESPVFLAAGLHTEGLQHFGCCAEPDRLALLLDGKGGQEDRHQSVLAEGHAELRVSGYLEYEATVAALVKQLVFWQAADRKAAEDEWPRIEAERLGGLLPVLPDQLNSLCLFELLFRYHQVIPPNELRYIGSPLNRAGRLACHPRR